MGGTVLVRDSDLRKISKKFCGSFEHCSECPVGSGCDDCIMFFIANSQCRPIDDIATAILYFQSNGIASAPDGGVRFEP